MSIHDEVIMTIGVLALAWVFRSAIGAVLFVILGGVAGYNVMTAYYDVKNGGQH